MFPVAAPEAVGKVADMPGIAAMPVGGFCIPGISAMASVAVGGPDMPGIAAIPGIAATAPAPWRGAAATLRAF
ncbi:hypothetical protein [Phenylobacterium sp.]|uniref:hypothetical protein n=1 Tax=Phenylobacterium sp. TaxID=1871053 RepID=UPI00286C01C2|nr:hypothetical protein [Phenylobacterium sp.]